MKSTNRKWQNHLRAKGIIPFFMDRLESHALSCAWQHNKGAFHFPIKNREMEDELTRAFFELTESFPYEIFIEITNTCNLNCKMCARSRLTRPMGFMSNKLFNRIIDEISVKQPYAYIHYYGIGEPLLDKGLFKKLGYAYKKGIRNTVLFTNGQLLTRRDMYKKLADSGVAIIGVDLDGFSQKTYGQIRVGGEFSAAKEGIEKLYRYARKNDLRTRVEIAYQIYPGINEQDIKPFVKWCEENDYEYKLVTMHTWAGLRDDVPVTEVDGLADQHHMRRRYPCCALWSGLMIAWDGRIGLCFQDADMKEVLGDINKESIEKVWTGRHLRKKKEHVKGVFKGLCGRCDSLTSVELPDKNSRLYPKSLQCHEFGIGAR